MTASQQSQLYPGMIYYPGMHSVGRPGPGVPHNETSPNLLNPRHRSNRSSPSSPVGPQLPLSPLTPPLPSGTPHKPTAPIRPIGRTAVDKYHLHTSDSGYHHSPAHSQSSVQLPPPSASSQQLPVQHIHSRPVFYGGHNSDTAGSEGASHHCSDVEPQDDLSDTESEDEWSDCDITQV